MLPSFPFCKALVCMWLVASSAYGLTPNLPKILSGFDSDSTPKEEATSPSATEGEEPPANGTANAQKLEMPRYGCCIAGGKLDQGTACRFKLGNLELRPVQVIIQSQGLLNLTATASSGESEQLVPTELSHPAQALGIAHSYKFSPQPNRDYYLSVSGQKGDFVLIAGYSANQTPQESHAAAQADVAVELSPVSMEEEGSGDFWLYALAIPIALLLAALVIYSLFFLKSSRPQFAIRFQCLNGPRLKALVNMDSLKRKPLTFGRSSECRVTLPDKIVSSRHGAFINDGGSLAIVDYESKNGTFVNNKRILGHTPIHVSAKDDIVIGSVHVSISPYVSH